MKKQVKIATGAAAVLLIGLIGFCAWFLSGVGSAEYYSQIDNSRIEQVDSKGGVINLKGSLPYAYTLLCYDENGGEKEITFGTSRELRDGAFIRLTVMPIRGVLDWSCSITNFQQQYRITTLLHSIPATVRFEGAVWKKLNGYAALPVEINPVSK